MEKFHGATGKFGKQKCNFYGQVEFKETGIESKNKNNFKYLLMSIKLAIINYRVLPSDFTWCDSDNWQNKFNNIPLLIKCSVKNSGSRSQFCMNTAPAQAALTHIAQRSLNWANLYGAQTTGW